MAKLSEFLSPALKEELARLAVMPDSEIDTSDIPEQKDWSGAVRGRFNKGRSSLTPQRPARPMLRPKYRDE